MIAAFRGLVALPVFVDGRQRFPVWCNGYIQHGRSQGQQANITPCVLLPGGAEPVPVGHHYLISLRRLASLTLNRINKPL